jgi:hypothetical protein
MNSFKHVFKNKTKSRSSARELGSVESRGHKKENLARVAIPSREERLVKKHLSQIWSVICGWLSEPDLDLKKFEELESKRVFKKGVQYREHY